MAGMINQLIELLNEQAARYEELLGLSREKKDVIIGNDINALQKITHLENLVVSQNQKLEKKRLSVIRDMASVLGKREQELTLSALIEYMNGQEEQAALIEIGSRIRATLGELSNANALNASLIQNALEYVEFSMNVIRTTANQNPGFYTAKGETMAEDTGLFDARH